MVTLISTQGQALYAIHKDSESRNTQSVQFLCHDWFVFQNQEWDIKNMAFKTTHNKDESLPQFMKSPQLIFSHN